MSTGLARITIHAPQRRLDVALPEHVPLVELLPELLRHAGEGLADDGERHGGWLLRRADGAALAAAQGLFPQGVRDGEVLHLVPARLEWPELEYDDVAETIAEGARRRGAVWTPASTRTATLVAAGLLLALGLAGVLGAGPRWAAGPFAALAVAVLLVLAGAAASRAYGDASAGAALGAGALPYAAAGGTLLVASGDPAGVLAPLPWLGGPELLSGAVTLLVFAVLAAAGVAAATRIFTAGCVVGLFAALTALLGLVTSAAGAAAVLLSVAVCGIGALPLLAIRFGRLPTPPVTLPTGVAAQEGFTGAGPTGGPVAPDPARELPERTGVFAAVSRTEDLLAGLLFGHGVLVAGAFVVLVLDGGTAARVLVAVAAAAQLLRSRLFVTSRQRVPLLASGLAGVAALGLDLLQDATTVVLTAVTLGAVVAALVSVVAGATYSRRPPSPYLGRAADILDTLLVVSVIPVACAVLGLYGRVADIGP